MSRPFQLNESAEPVVTSAGVRVIGFVRDGMGGWMIRAVDPTSDTIEWETSFDMRLQLGPYAPRFASRGPLLFASVENVLVCLQAADGRMRWSVRLPKEVDTTSRRWKQAGAADMLELELIDTPAGARVCCGISDSDDYVVLLDARDGRMVAMVPADSHWRHIEGVGIAAVEDWVLKVHDGDGHVLWECEARGVESAGQDLLVHSPDDTLRLVDAATGEARWTKEAPDLSSVNDGTTGAGTVLVLSDKGPWPFALSSGPAAPGIFAKLFGKSRGLAMKGSVDEVHQAGGDRFVTVGYDGDDYYVSVVDGGAGAVVDTQAVPGADNLCVRTGNGLAVARIEKDSENALRAMTSDGSVKWERDLGEDLSEYFCVGDDVLAVLMRQVALLDGATGKSRWAYTY